MNSTSYFNTLRRAASTFATRYWGSILTIGSAVGFILALPTNVERMATWWPIIVNFASNPLFTWAVALAGLVILARGLHNHTQIMREQEEVTRKQVESKAAELVEQKKQLENETLNILTAHFCSQGYQENAYYTRQNLDQIKQQLDAMEKKIESRLNEAEQYILGQCLSFTESRDNALQDGYCRACGDFKRLSDRIESLINSNVSTTN